MRAALVLVAALAVVAGCQPVPRTAMDAGPAVAETMTPGTEPMAEQIFNGAMSYVRQFDTATGETFCWHARARGGSLLTGYLAYRDPVWLDYAQRYCDELIARMATGPDGYKGFIGTYGYDQSVWCDVHIGDSILVNMMLEFAEIVLADEALTERYGAKARAYVDLARKHLIEKWDARGTWREDGPYGGWVSWNRFGEPGNFTDWPIRDDVAGATLGLPHNKNMDLAVACLRIYRITGQRQYRDKAAKVFALFKSRLQYFDDHYLWNYWEPVTVTDVDLGRRNTRHWMNVHPYRNYQAGEIDDIVEAYHTGVVFSEEDIRRIINTNLKVMWNGDLENPQWSNSNVTLPGYKPAEPSEHYPTWAGTLWGALADFDPTVRQLAAPRGGDSRNAGRRLAADYFNNVISARPPSFERRRLVEPAEVFDVPLGDCNAVTVAAVLPSRIQRGTPSVLLSKMSIGGTMRIDLLDAKGRKTVTTLHEGQVGGGMDGHGGVFIHTFDGGDVKAGDYLVRWTFNDGYRLFPVRIEE
ncbi:MAG: hypothetical protein GX591_17745 [Planctomycetes bacterium]|nr:hypothetical protein [Planctomycetota bacterium]